MQTEIINIGDELLIGQVVNTNAAWMAEQMSLAGFPVHRISVIPDDPQQIMEALNLAGRQSDIILITGGLGPTKDDLTKDVLCRFFNTKLVFHEDTFRFIEQFFSSRGLKVTEINRKQAEVPKNCTVLPNPNGTAPGMWFEKAGEGRNRKSVFVSMPGVPFEMKALVTHEVLPRLKACFLPLNVLHHTILTQGIGESFLSDKLEDWETRLPENLHLAYLPQPGIVRLRITGQGDDEFLLRKQMEEETAKLKTLIPDYIFGEGDETLEAVVGSLLKEKGFTVTTAESCTGGYIAHLITSIPGSSAWYKGSVIAYSNEIKTKQLGVNETLLMAHGAVSEEVVKEMAVNIRGKFDSSYSIAISGIAGPDGGTEEKPVGTVWIAIAGPTGVRAHKYLFGDNRERNIRRSALQALNLLRKTILSDLSS
ncbi:MAG: competence/damage-inducible protein A [Bacteroidetes bacterium]|nr:competence/damage-inducible protein A [Bacteroidota bacterium]